MALASPTSHHIAVVDDDPIFQELTCAMLASRSDLVPVAASSGDDLLKVLDEQSVSCILLDFDLGKESGFTVKAKLDRHTAKAPPIIMLTGDGRERTVIEAFRLGIADYLPKADLRPEQLLATIDRVVAEAETRRNAQDAHRRLEQAVQKDTVTDLSGRSAVEQRLRELEQLGPEDQRGFTIFLAELQQYHTILEHYGMSTAEEALRHFAGRLGEICQGEDVCGRLVDGSFVLVKKHRADPATSDELCGRVADYLSVPLTVPFGTLHLSAKVSTMACGSAAAAKPDPWQAIAAAVKPTEMPDRPATPALDRGFGDFGDLLASSHDRYAAEPHRTAHSFW